MEQEVAETPVLRALFTWETHSCAVRLHPAPTPHRGPRGPFVVHGRAGSGDDLPEARRAGGPFGLLTRGPALISVSLAWGSRTVTTRVGRTPNAIGTSTAARARRPAARCRVGCSPRS